MQFAHTISDFDENQTYNPEWNEKVKDFDIEILLETVSSLFTYIYIYKISFFVSTCTQNMINHI